MKNSNAKAFITRWQPFCQRACPLGNYARDWLKLVKTNKLEEAWRLLVSRNLLPATMGRICYHFCEANCRRKIDDKAVAVASIERWLGDQALKRGWSLNAPNSAASQDTKRVLVVGAGPAGLSAAYQLAHLGYKVSVIEKKAYAGGELMRTLPAYRLPPNILQAEITRILNYPNITFNFNHSLEMARTTKVPEGFDAMILTTGASMDRPFKPSSDDKSVYTLKLGEFLAATKQLSAPTATLGDPKLISLDLLGETLAVYGGGNSAIDAARAALRLGVKNVYLIYRRSKECMPGFKEELDEALDEDVKFLTLRSIIEIKNGQLVLEINELDANLRPKATGKFETLSVNSLVLALGHQVDPNVFQDLEHEGGYLKTFGAGQSSVKNIWVAGDLAGGACNASSAVGSGWRAALGLHNFFMGLEDAKMANNINLNDFEAIKSELVNAMPAKPRAEAKALSISDRSDFSEVVCTLTDDEAISEASRCYSCGSCRTCGNCIKTCPAKAISFNNLNKTPTIARHPVVDITKCLSCGACTKRCPCGVIKLSP